MLGVFKYFNFFEDTLVRLAALVGWHLDAVTLDVVLPIGISFYTFMTVSYVIDVYRRDIEPTTHPLDFALFVAYFPHLVAGPILRASLLLPQIARPRAITAAQSWEGLWLIGWGCFQKMFVADNLARLVDTVYRSVGVAGRAGRAAGDVCVRAADLRGLRGLLEHRARRVEASRASS